MLEPAVVREAMHALANGRPRLVAIEGSCASEGLIEVFIEPQLPEPLLAIVGDGPAGADARRPREQDRLARRA